MPGRRRRWRRCPWARPSARWSTRCSSTPTPAPRPARRAARTSTEQLTWWPVELDVEVLADALVAVLDSPLGRPLADDATLRRIGTRDRLCELDFELPPSRRRRSAADETVLLGDIATLLRRHLPEGDPVRAYADALDNPPLGGQVLRGYLTGSIDVVLRLRGEGEDPRYVVVDYKTNWLGPVEEPLTAASYDRRRWTRRWATSDYPLQALLYAVVLHRFLRWRQPGYDPAVHLGGVAYLYLRGCAGRTPRWSRAGRRASSPGSHRSRW